MRLGRNRLSYALLLIAAFSGVASASELSDSMQLFFTGNYDAARGRLTAIIDSGVLDARTHYFRGLASARLGDTAAAAADFQRGATLELQGAGTGVGQALQRVQGGERLMLERYRTMARLRAKHRVQPVAPKPVVPKTPSPVVQTTAEFPVSAPRFRLASEVPVREQVGDAAKSTDMLANEKMPNGPEAPSAAKSQDAPVGTGVASKDAPSADFDPFADDTAETAESTPSPATSDGGVVGSVFRAIGRAAANPSAALAGGAVAESSAVAETEDVDPFGEANDATDPFADDPNTFDEEDPFGDL